MPLDLAFVRSQFPALAGDWVFMDNAGGSQILESVVDRIRDYLLTSNVQLGASYAVSERAAERLRDAQTAIAEFLNAERPEEAVMGPSATALLQTLARAMGPTLAPGDEVVVSRMDHESNIGPWIGLEALGVTVKFWEVNHQTTALDLESLDRLMSPKTRLVAFTHTSNIFGAIVPIAEITRVVHDHGARVCVDGVAFAPHRAIDVRAWDVDYYVCSFYKVFGPHHAVLFGKYAHLLELANLSHYFTPADRIPAKLQPGNLNYELSVGAAGIPDYLADLGRRTGTATGGSRRSHIDAAFVAIAEHESRLADRLLGFLRTRRAVRVVGPTESDDSTRVPTISFVVDGVDSKALVADVDRLNIGIRFGDFHSRRLIEDLDLTRSNGVVRVSLVHYNTLEEVDRLIEGLDRLIPGRAV
jgi:cysteine desulfurase family protein (TIGR01976 family)